MQKNWHHCYTKITFLSTFLLFVSMCGPVFSQNQGIGWLNLPSIPNARDAGGVYGSDGAYIPRGVLYRSNHPAALLPEECLFFKQRGLRSIVDLRYERERLAAPDSPCLLEFVNYVEAGIGTDADYLQGLSPEELYLLAMNQYTDSLQKFFETLSNPQNIPVLIHCSSGKDRTGMVVAMVYLLVGVSEEETMAEYLRSNDAGFEVDASWLQAVLDEVKTEGGIEPFLESRGITPEMQAAVRSNLIIYPSSVSTWEEY